MNIQNDAPVGMAFTSDNQSVAAFVAADKVAFYHCAFFSLHNTLFDNKGRHYYHQCYIQGSIDFIFGRATSIFNVYFSPFTQPLKHLDYTNNTDCNDCYRTVRYL